uniref:Uncharacterized protein n=1 Tax=Populus trichocarpa TaxID=3694 RepID=A9PDZ5_POPTR|nr:unknown [Populus trichocarpa]
MDSILVIGNKIDVCHLQISQALPHLSFTCFPCFLQDDVLSRVREERYVEVIQICNFMRNKTGT